MLIIYVAALLGIFRFRSRSYWKWIGFLLVWMFGASLLFAGGGTLDDPSGDGFIAHQVRIATNDGLGMGLFSLAFIIAYWGGAIWMLRKAYLAGRQFEEEQGDRTDEEIELVGLGRKALEAVVVTLIGGLYVYGAYLLPFQTTDNALSSATIASPAEPAESPAPDPVASALAATAEQLMGDVPKKLDPITTLVSISAEGRVLTYHNKLSRRDASDDALRSFIRKNGVTKACKNADMMLMMKDYGVTFRYSYAIPNATTPLTVDATFAECQTLGLAQ